MNNSLKSLTRRQQEIYQHLLNHFAQNNHAPTLDELCYSLKLKSRGSLHKHIQALIDADLLLPLNGKQRGIQLKQNEYDTENNLPFLGKIAAGNPIEAVEDAKMISVPEYLRSNGQCFVLQVVGDSMIDVGIFDDDLVVIEKTETARHGEIVVALVDDIDVTLKRIQTEKNQVILHPENSAMSPLSYHASRIKIQGRLVGQMRKYV